MWDESVCVFFVMECIGCGVWVVGIVIDWDMVVYGIVNCGDCIEIVVLEVMMCGFLIIYDDVMISEVLCLMFSYGLYCLVVVDC